MSNQIQGLQLSPQQRRLWLLQPDSSAYIAQCAILLKGSLSAKDLKEALQKVVNRHEILRTTFHRRPGIKIPIQVITNCSSPLWNNFNLSEKSPEEQEAEVEALFQKEELSSFDFENAPLLQASLLTLSTDKHILHLNLPSLCADAQTLKHLVHEISHFYTESSHDKAELDKVVQYAEFSEWQNNLLEDEEAEVGKAYWQKQGISAFFTLTLPSQGTPFGKSEFAFGSLTSVIEEAGVTKIEAMAQRYDTSIASCLLACWQILLWRLTGQFDIVVGNVLDGRKYQELHDALGLFAKSVPIHCYFEDTFRFREFLVRVNQSTSDAYDWQEYFTWEQSEESAGNVMNFSIGFEFDEQLSRHCVAGVSFSVYKQYTCIERFKVKLSCARRDDSLITELHYDANLFSAEDIRSLARQFHTLLESALDNPETEIGELTILSDIEQQELLINFNNTKADYPEDKCIHQLFEEQAACTPESIAVIFEDQQLTYRELNVRANQLANHLCALGVEPEVRVGICMKHSLEMIVGILGILKAGGAYLPLDPAYPRERLTFMLADAQPSVLLTQQQLIEGLSGYEGCVICLDAGWEIIAKESQDNLVSEVNPGNLAYEIYTSGSTGKSKGVMIPHQGLVNYLSWCIQAYAVADGQGVPVHSSIGFDLTVTSLFSPLLVGIPVILLLEGQAFNALNTILRSRSDFSLVKITPSHLEALSQLLFSDELDGRTRMLVIGGEALFETHLSFWRNHAPGTRLINEYGPTETVVGSSVYEVPAEVSVSAPIPIGRPIANTQIYLLDSYLRPVPIGVPGELHIGGPGLARGYLNRPDQTVEKFIPNPFNEAPGARLYRTGDLARFLRCGNLEFLGRIDHQVKIRGFRIELGEVEAVLDQHPAVQEAVVLARHDLEDNKCLVGYLVPNTGQTPRISELRRFLKDKLPDYMAPQFFVFLNALPLTENGKINRQALPAPDRARSELEEAFVAPRNRVEELLVSIWTEVLGIEKVGVHDDFFRLGGHSLLAVQLISRLHNTLQVELPVRLLFENTTIAELSSAIIVNEVKPGQTQQLARILLKVEEMSTEEVQKALKKRRRK